MRVLGNLLEFDGFDYATCEDVREELQAQIGEVAPDNRHAGEYHPPVSDGEPSWDGVLLGIYETDALVRRSEPLQQTALGQPAAAEQPEARTA